MELVIAAVLTLTLSFAAAWAVGRRKRARWDTADLPALHAGDFIRVTSFNGGKVILAEGPVTEDDGEGFTVKDVEYPRYVYFTRTGLRLGAEIGVLLTEIRTKL